LAWNYLTLTPTPLIFNRYLLLFNPICWYQLVVINSYPYPYNSYSWNPYSLHFYPTDMHFTPVLRSFDTAKYIDINQWFISPKEVLLAQEKGFSLFALCLSISVDRQEGTMTPQSTFLLGTYIKIHHICIVSIAIIHFIFLWCKASILI
jgi:hypothetical protein